MGGPGSKDGGGGGKDGGAGGKETAEQADMRWEVFCVLCLCMVVLSLMHVVMSSWFDCLSLSVLNRS